MRGGFDAAIRRSMANAGAQGIADALDVDFHHTTLIAWEHKVYAAMMARHWTFYKWCGDMMRTSSSNDTMIKFEVHLLRGDCTHAMLKRKLHTAEISSAYCHNLSSAAYLDSTDPLIIERVVETHTAWADVLETDDESGRAMHAMYQKQVESIGLESHWAVKKDIGHLHAWCSVTDDGSNESKFKKIQGAYIKQTTKKGFVIGVSCNKHQLNLITQAVLTTMDIICVVLGCPH